MTAKQPATDTRRQLHVADRRRCALPAAPDSDGLCYPHAHAPHRRLRLSDLTRDLAPSQDALISTHKLRRILAKLPVAVAEGLFTPREAGTLIALCNLMLSCNRQARKNPILEPISGNQAFLASLLATDYRELSHPPQKG